MFRILMTIGLLACSQVLFGVVPNSSLRAAQSAKPSPEFTELGDEGLLQLPTDLADLVRRNQAAVVAEMRGFGDVTLRNATTPKGTVIGIDGWANYQVRIKEVLFNKLGSKAPPLQVNTIVNVTQHVGREEAKAFVSRSRVRENDECLLFLWYLTGTREWSLVAWPLQFRRSPLAEGMAEPVVPKGDMTWLDRDLSVSRTPNGIQLDWSSLIDEVKRLGAL